MTRGQAGGLNFVLPGSGGGFLQPGEAELAAQQQFNPAVKVDPMMPKLDMDLAYDEAITQQYYDVYGQLKNYVENMAMQGVDVTRPMIGQDNTPHLTFKKFQADLMRTATELKQRKDVEKVIGPQVAAGQFQVTDPKATSIQDAGFSTRPSQRLTAALQNLGRPPMNDTDARSQQQLFASEQADYQRRINSEPNPNRRAALQNELEQLTSAYKQSWKPPVPRVESAANEARKAKLDAAESLYRQVTNKKAGVFEAPEYEVDENFNVIAKDKSFSDTQMGEGIYSVSGKKVSYPKVIDYFYRKDGKTYVKYLQPQALSRAGKLREGVPVGSDGIIKDEPLTTSGADLTRSVVENNKLGITNADVLTALQEKGLLDPTTRYSKDDNVINKEGVINSPDSKAIKEVADKMVQDMTKKGELPKVELPSGQIAEVKSGFRGYYIEVDGVEQVKRLDAKGVVNWLRGMKYFDQFISQPTTSSTTTNPFLD